MGLFLKLDLFYGADPDVVFESYKVAYAQKGRPLLDHGTDGWDHTIHEVSGGWVPLTEGIGWEWEVRRDVQRAVSGWLGCSSLCCFVYDGDYWGYELIDAGEPIDQFVQDAEPSDGSKWFPGRNTEGDATTFALLFDWLEPKDVEPYLVRNPALPAGLNVGSPDFNERYEQYRRIRDALNVKPRPDDQFRRFDECAVIDFLRLLHVDIFLGPDPKGHWPFGVVQLRSPVRHRFWVPQIDS